MLRWSIPPKIARATGRSRPRSSTSRAALRYDQYRDALKDDSAFLRRFMTLPFAVPDARFRKDVGTHDGDEGIHDTTLAGLKQAQAGARRRHRHFRRPDPSGGRQCRHDRRRPRTAVAQFTAEPGIEIRILGFGQSRERPCLYAGGAGEGREARARRGGAVDRQDRRVQVAQSVRRERHRVRARDRRRSDRDEQLRLLAGVRPSAGADRHCA